jgi:hypothetical protein
MQREQITRLRAREQTWLELLQRPFDASERELRVAELADSFDAKRVNELVANQAELAGYLRGTESRVVAEIAALWRQSSGTDSCRCARRTRRPPPTRRLARHRAPVGGQLRR